MKNILIKWILHNVLTTRAFLTVSDTDCEEVHEEYYRSWIMPKHVLKGESLVSVPDDYVPFGHFPFEIPMPIGGYTAEMVDQMSSGWVQSQGAVCPTIEQAEQAFGISLDVVKELVADKIASYLTFKKDTE